MERKPTHNSLNEQSIIERLREEAEELRRRLDEAEQTLEAIRRGDVDALVIDGPQGEQIFSLSGADRLYRTIVETMNEAALTVSLEGAILFCNRRFCELMRTPPEIIVGQALNAFVPGVHHSPVAELLAGAEARPILRLTLLATDGTEVPVQMAANLLESIDGPTVCLVASDLSELEASVQSVQVLRKQQEALRQTQAELAQRNTELQQAIADQQASRLAALNVMEDAVAARGEAEQAVAALRASEENFRMLADNMSQFAWIAKADGWIYWYNRRWYEYSGTTFDQMQGWGWTAVHHLDHLDHVMKSWKQAHVTGEPWEDTFPLRGRDGQYRWFLSRALPIRDSSGNVQRWFGTNTDITEQREAERRLQEKEELLRTAMAAGAMGAWDFDLETQQIRWDAKQSELFGRPPHQSPADAEDFYRLVYPQDVAKVKEATLSAIKTGRFSEEFRIVLPDGRIRWIVGHGATVSDRQGRLVRMVGVNYDITERKETQARIERFAEELESQVIERTRELEGSQKRLRALATELNLAEQRERRRLAAELHDHLQQTLVLGKLKLGQGKRLARELPACADLMHQLDGVFSEALQYTRSLVADLSPSVLRDHGLPAGLKWLGDYMQKHDVTVTVQVPNEDIRLPEDQVVLLFQSVRELLINSSKYAGTGEATVTLQQREERLLIVVRDDGAGFDLAAVPERNDVSPLSSKFGLFSIRERMKALGGWFDLQSAPGQGTTATLILPLAPRAVNQEKAEPDLARENAQEAVEPIREESGRIGKDRPLLKKEQARLHRQEASSHPQAKVRVLLVDDHAMVRQGLRAILDGYADIDVVGEAADGEEAVASVERLSPAIVIMDINMPKLNGVEATAKITARHPDVSVIGLSVNAGGESAEAMVRAGAVTLLTKEAAVDELYNTIRALREAADVLQAAPSLDGKFDTG
jgi:PAS domain S-box-containing protein